MQFRMKVITASNEVFALHLEAASEAMARQAVERQGYSVLAVASRGFAANRRFPRHSRFSVHLFSVELLALLEAGLNLIEALQALSEKAATESSQQVLGPILQSLNSGESFSKALEKLPAHFSALYVATVRASERTGDLKEALARYLAYQEEFERVRRKVVSACLYPAILLVVGTGVLIFLVLYVVPRFARVYEDIPTGLPFFSKILLTVGTGVERHGSFILGLLIALVLAVAYGVSKPSFRAWANERLWRTPALGERMKLYQLARLYLALSMLLRAGIPVVRAIDMMSGLLTMHLREGLRRARAFLEEGQSISTAFTAVGLTTPVSTRMLIVGEKSGHMADMMERIARLYDDETSRFLDTFTRTFEPVLMAALGLAVGLVVVLMYMPIFELAGSLQ